MLKDQNGIVSYASTKLLNLNKKGKMDKDENGWYVQPVGAYGTTNSAGHFYSKEGVEKLYESSSYLQLKIQENALEGENGHPRTKGMSDEDTFDRLMDTVESRVCVQFGELWLDYGMWKKFPGQIDAGGVVVMARYRPAGELGYVLKESLERGDASTSFSVRGFTRNRQEGSRIVRYMSQVITYDKVALGGVKMSSKYQSPMMEQYAHDFLKEDVMKSKVLKAVAMEHSGFDLKNLLNKADKPKYSKW